METGEPVATDWLLVYDCVKFCGNTVSLWPYTMYDLFFTPAYFVYVPCNTGKLVNLEELGLAGNTLSSVPSELSECQKLRRLNLSGLRWRTGLHTMSAEQLGKLIDEHPVTAKMSRQVSL